MFSLGFKGGRRFARVTNRVIELLIVSDFQLVAIQFIKGALTAPHCLTGLEVVVVFISCLVK